MALADIARSIENNVNRRGIVRRRHQGWLPRIYPFTGYGSTTELHVIGRAIMAAPSADAKAASRAKTAAKSPKAAPRGRAAGKPSGGAARR